MRPDALNFAQEPTVSTGHIILSLEAYIVLLIIIQSRDVYVCV